MEAAPLTEMKSWLVEPKTAQVSQAQGHRRVPAPGALRIQVCSMRLPGDRRLDKFEESPMPCRFGRRPSGGCGLRKRSAMRG